MSVFAKRLKEIRKLRGLSQEKLGTLAGIDEASASGRMNHYERGRHEPDFTMVERLASVLNVPEAYFYAKDDEMAQLLQLWPRLKKAQRQAISTLLEELAAP
ncbi:MAG TPA: helix-turn-helix transcriptional regulator [Cellvibrionaceae bacterium]|nr:helix-turn-helix transcriptional regulator [Cellvibrionaceae bacterium]